MYGIIFVYSIAAYRLREAGIIRETLGKTSRRICHAAGLRPTPNIKEVTLAKSFISGRSWKFSKEDYARRLSICSNALKHLRTSRKGKNILVLRLCNFFYHTLN